MTNTLQQIILRTKNKNKNFTGWLALSMNPNIDIKFVEENMDLPWNWEGLSANRNVTFEDIKRHIDDFEPDVFGIAKITIDDVKNNPTIPWNEYLSKNSNISIADIEANIDLVDWNWWEMSSNQTVTLAFVLSHDPDAWNWAELSRNKGIKIEDIEANMDLDWEFDMVSDNPNLTLEFVSLYEDLDWDWAAICEHKDITIDFVLDNLDKDLEWMALSSHSGITLGDILDNRGPGMLWQWNGVSSNPNVCFSDMLNNPNLPWDWLNLSQNPNITMDIILKHPNHPWNLSGIALNPNLTIEVFDYYKLDKYFYYYVSNDFTFNHGLNLLKQKIISQAWKIHRARKISTGFKVLVDKLPLDVAMYTLCKVY